MAREPVPCANLPCPRAILRPVAATITPETPLTFASPEEIEALLVAVNDKLDAIADDDRRACLLRGRARLERVLSDQLAA